MQRRTVLLVVVVSLTFSFSAFAKKKKPKPETQLTPEQRAQHLLNRFTFGPRPGEPQRVLAQGLDQWFEQQLAPDSIPDKALDARLGPYRTLRMQPKQMAMEFPPPPLVKAVIDGKMPMPTNQYQQLIYRAQVARFQSDQRIRTASAVEAQAGMMPAAAMDVEAQREQFRKELEQKGRALGEELLAAPPEQRMAKLQSYSDDQLMDLAGGLRGDQRERLLATGSAEQRESILAMGGPQIVISEELQQAKLLRAVNSERQLQEVMTDFWFNHFNVYLSKDADAYLTTAYERDAIRAHALGKFKDLLMAVAHSPAMLVYLDNYQSIGPDSKAAQGGRRSAPDRGLNENYARELMELHTLGVDGGYTQTDVTEVAKVFTGWGIDKPENGYAFLFDPRRHQPGSKTVLGQTIKENGESEGEELLRLLARQPATARFISRKLAQRFVSDDPPPALVDAMAKTFLDSDGDIKAVLRTLYHAPEFWAPSAYRAKLKTPFEFVASAMRATSTDIQIPMQLVGALYRMGMPLYLMQPPTGYSTLANHWNNSDALLDRLNFAMGLAGGRFNGLRFEPERAIALELLSAPEPPAQPAKGKSKSAAASAEASTRALAALESSLIGAELSPQTAKIVDSQWKEQLQQTPVFSDLGKALTPAAGLLLGSPEFQKR